MPDACHRRPTSDASTRPRHLISFSIAPSLSFSPSSSRQTEPSPCHRRFQPPLAATRRFLPRASPQPPPPPPPRITKPDRDLHRSIGRPEQSPAGSLAAGRTPPSGRLPAGRVRHQPSSTEIRLERRRRGVAWCRGGGATGGEAASQGKKRETPPNQAMRVQAGG